MSDERLIADLKVVKGDCNIVRIKLQYDIVGMNYFTGSTVRRGLYLSVTPLTVGEGSTSYRGFSGFNYFVKPLKRFSKKQLAETEPNEDQVRMVLKKVLGVNGIELEEEYLGLK